MNKLHLRPTQKYASAAAILSHLDCKERAIQYLGLTDASFRGPVWRDSPDDNGAAIKMRAASRHDMMIALSLSLCKPFYGACLQFSYVIATKRRQPCPQCPESDRWPSKWRPSRRAISGH